MIFRLANWFLKFFDNAFVYLDFRSNSFWSRLDLSITAQYFFRLIHWLTSNYVVIMDNGNQLTKIYSLSSLLDICSTVPHFLRCELGHKLYGQIFSWVSSVPLGSIHFLLLRLVARFCYCIWADHLDPLETLTKYHLAFTQLQINFCILHLCLLKNHCHNIFPQINRMTVFPRT